MKKEINIHVVIEGNKLGSVIQKSGYADDLSSSFEVTGILQKLLHDEQTKLDEKLKTEKTFSVRENKNGL
jgi:hypothetical protein